MDPGEIPKHQLEENLSEVTKILRRNTTELLISLIEDGVLENINSLADLPSGTITALEGGVTSACFFLENNGQPIVVKFRTWGIEAEAETLKVWSDQGVSVPTVKSSGTVLLDIKTKNPVKYLVIEGITGPDGNPAPNAGEFLRQNPTRVEELGTILGEQLYLMHHATTFGNFGAFADINWDQAESWNQYLSQNLVQKNSGYLQQIGISLESIAQVIEITNQVQFPSQGSYLHNDFGTHNILVVDSQPLRVVVFDPNPMIGDPYFDLASMILRLDFQKVSAQIKSETTEPTWFQNYRRLTESLIKSYVQHTGQELDDDRLLANLIGISIRKGRWAMEHARSEETQIRIQVLKRYIEQFIA